MSESSRRLEEVSREYEEKANSAHEVYTSAARAEAAYRHERAKAVLRHKLSRDRMSVAEAEIRADAQEDIGELLQRRLVLAAAAEGLKAKLYELKERVGSCRTSVVGERTADQFHSRGYGGSA
jgi:hypothetical protein